MATVEEIRTSITGLLNEATGAYKRSWAKLLGAMTLAVVPFIPLVGLEVGLIQLTEKFATNANEVGPVGWITIPLVVIIHLTMILGMIAVQLGFLRLTLKAARDEQFSIVKELMGGLKLMKNMVLMGLVAAPAIVLGTLCLIVPGIYLAIRFSMATMAIADGAGPMEAVKSSFRLTRGHMIEIIALYFLYHAASFALMFLPILNIFILIFVGIPFINLFWAVYYNSLKSNQVEELPLNVQPAQA